MTGGNEEKEKVRLEPEESAVPLTQPGKRAVGKSRRVLLLPVPVSCPERNIIRLMLMAVLSPSLSFLTPGLRPSRTQSL